MNLRPLKSLRTVLGAIAVGACLASPAAAAPADLDPSVVQQTVDRASYTVSPRVGESRSRTATLRNDGTSTIETGRSFWIGRLTPSGWKRLHHSRNCAWPADARIIRPGDSYSQRVGLLGRRCRFKALEPGTYRVVKAIWFTDGVSGQARDAIVRARFEVIR